MFTDIILVTKDLRCSFYGDDDFGITLEQRAFESKNDALRYFYYLKQFMFNEGFEFVESSKVTEFQVTFPALICKKRNLKIKLSVKSISLMKKA